MAEDKIIYTDGHDVTVTDTTLVVRKHEYILNGVTQCGLMVLRPQRAPGIILLVLGIALIICGLMQVIPQGAIPDVEIANRSYGVNTMAVWAGAALSLIGLLILGIVRERYAVRIATAEGEKDAVVSDKREYVSQIVDAINHATSFLRVTPPAGSRYFTVKST